MLASGEGYLEIAKLLIQNKADVNAKVESGWDSGKTALMLASEKGHTKIKNLLLKNGAKISLLPELNEYLEKFQKLLREKNITKFQILESEFQQKNLSSQEIGRG